jgi:F-box-like/WD domain, G-beta repeat
VYEVLAYLPIKDLTNSMTVSTTWFQACNCPLLWRRHYFDEMWEISDEVFAHFLTRLNHLQAQFERHFDRFRRLRSQTPSYDVDKAQFIPTSIYTGQDIQGEQLSTHVSLLYDRFFNNLDFVNNGIRKYSNLLQLRAQFNAITHIEIGPPFHHSMTFMLQFDSFIQVCVDWRYIYKNRALLETNWRSGRYQAAILDGTPGVSSVDREGIYCVYFDSKFLATGSRDKCIRLWDMQKFDYIGKLEGHKESVLCLQLDSARGMLVSGSSDSTIKIWDLNKRILVQTLLGHEQNVLGLYFSGNYIISCSRDSTVRIWSCQLESDNEADVDTSPSNRQSLNSGTRIPKFYLRRILCGHKAPVNSVHFKGDIIATASGDRTVRLWKLPAGILIRTIQAHKRGVACVQISGRTVVTGSSDNVIKIFHMDTGEELNTLRGHTDLVRTIQTDSLKIISGSYDQSIRIWDLKTGEMLQELSNCHSTKYPHPLVLCLQKDIWPTPRSKTDYIMLWECKDCYLGFHKISE